MGKSREVTNISVRRGNLRPRVRAMEAFGWVLGETFEKEGKMVVLSFWRPMDLPDSGKLKKLELELSRIPAQEGTLALKYVIGVLICILLGSIAASVFGFGLVAFYIVWMVGLVVLYVLERERRRLKKRRERIIERAKMLTSARESVRSNSTAG